MTATYDPAVIRAAIATILANATTLAFVYPDQTAEVAGYPAVIFDMTDEAGEMLDEVTNLRTLTFTLWIMQEVTSAGESAAKTILDASVKEVVNLLENTANYTLGNTVDWTMPLNGARRKVQTPQGLVMIQEVILKAKVASLII